MNKTIECVMVKEPLLQGILFRFKKWVFSLKYAYQNVTLPASFIQQLLSLKVSKIRQQWLAKLGVIPGPLTKDRMIETNKQTNKQTKTNKKK